MSNRILDYPEATEITSDDYILLDNAGTDAKCIKASALNINMDNYTIKEARGSIASFDDGEDLPLAFMGAYITAIQDLHGYDAPWVGGAGKNKFGIEGWLDSCGATYTKNGNSYTISATAALFNTPYQFSDTDVNVSVSAKSFIAGTATVIRVQLLDVNGNVVTNLGDSSSYQEKNSISASRVRFNWTTSGTFTITEPQIEFAPRATSFAPYSNICPISGWDECNVGVSGVNIWDEEWEVGSIADLDGQNATNSNYRRSKNYISVKANKRYYFNVPSKYGTTYRFYQYKQNKDYIGVKVVGSDGTFETDNDCAFIRFRIATTEDYTNDISINYPSTATTYEPYNGNTYSLTFTDGSNPLTVYGGTVDLVSGVLTVTSGYVDLGTLSWGSASDGRVYSSAIADIKPITGSSTVSNIMCSNYATVSARAVYDKTTNGSICIAGAGYGGDKCIGVYDSSLANKSASEVTQAMNGVQLVYELATPLTYQLSKQQIRSLVGENNIFADTGDSIVDYRKLWVKPEM